MRANTWHLSFWVLITSHPMSSFQAPLFTHRFHDYIFLGAEFHRVYLPHFHYPFISLRTFGLFPFSTVVVNRLTMNAEEEVSIEQDVKSFWNMLKSFWIIWLYGRFIFLAFWGSFSLILKHILIPVDKCCFHPLSKKLIYIVSRDHYRKPKLETIQMSLDQLEPRHNGYIFHITPAPRAQETWWKKV